MKIIHVMLVTPALFVLFLLSCNQNKEVRELNAFSKMKINDSLITEAVEDEISYHPEVPAHRIDVRTKDSIVFLTGSTENLLAKERAEEIASQVICVKGVVNQIMVKTDSLANNVLKNRVEGGLYYDPVTNPWTIKVKVNNGNVTLSGVVDSWQKIQFAGDVAKSIMGVKSVTNNLYFEYDSLRSDEDIFYEIKRIYLTDARLDHTLISVNVDGGVVTLTGVVGSLSEKSLAVTDAWVSGVRSVNADDLEVKYWARDPRMRVDKYVKKTDKEISSAIETAFKYDYRINNYDVNISVNNGYVTLSGKAGNLEAKNSAGDDARNIVGVWDVDNKIKVRPGILYSDKNVLGRVDTAFQRNPYLSKYSFTMNMLNGKLYLDGSVETPYEKVLAEKVASRIPGVIAIDNNLKVSHYFNPYSNFYYKYDYPVIEAPHLLPDEKIKENIEREFWRSPFVNSDEINIKVKNGHVILTGTVETALEKKAAEKNAYEGGAFTVENDIIVRYRPK